MPDRATPRRHGRTSSRMRALGGVVAVVALRLAWRRMMRPTHNQRAIAAATSREHERPSTPYEVSDWPLGPVALVYAGVVALLVISCLALIVAYPTALPDVSRARHTAPPGPRLQTNPEADLNKFRAYEQKRLDTYYWLDRQKGTVHIPIGEAMKKLVQTGIPGFPKAQP